MRVDILADSRRDARCRRCGQAITFAETLAGNLTAFHGELIVVSSILPWTDGREIETVDTRLNPVHATRCPMLARRSVRP